MDSPCINICVLDHVSGLCSGCGRTVAEIAAWSSITTSQRRAIMRLPRRERLAAIAEARRRAQEASQTPNSTVAPAEDKPAPAQRASRTKINLEVEASQPSTGAQISVLHAQVLIDGRPVKDFSIRFTGGNSFARWKKVENIEIDNVPLNAREITLAVATDPGLNEERMEGSTRLWAADTEAMSASLRVHDTIVRDAIEAHGGRYLMRGNPSKTFENGLMERIVVSEFESVAAAIAAHDSPGYQAALKVLGDGADRDIRIVEGL